MAHIVSARARADLDDLWDYLYQQSGLEAIADRQIEAITDRFYLLSQYPGVGRARDDDLGPGRRSFPVARYLIVYTVTGGGDVLILRVAHASRDLKTLT